MQDVEKLGMFYLGRTYDLAAGKRTDQAVLYDSRDLVTHGVCVGMTGSGKTGLCLALLEEAAIDGIPVIAIDPKGDLGNLLLTFPSLAPEDFRPWINEEDARRKGVSPDQFAASQAAMWKNGLAEWGQDGARIGRLRAAADFTIYTPGSTAGMPLSMLRSLDVPSQALIADRELLGERVSTTVSSLLTLAGIDAEPMRSREHILLSIIVNTAWTSGKGLDLAGLIQLIQQPPVQRVGVLELESFFPSDDRFGLATAFNNLLAAPGFEAWMQGEPLNVDRLLYTAEGKPRVSVISIAHLGDRERMFVVSLLLNDVLGWMRTQAGTTSLRALIYMDEMLGYFPPVANPPSKAPLLALLKQGRAFGLGLLLATQNPVDLDYKGLANAGTWLLGRLQTERDKARVLDGIEGAVATGGGSLNRAYVDRVLSGLTTRVFLMNNVHESEPVVLESRWAMSYLRGPLTRDQIRVLMAPRKTVASASAASAPSVAADGGTGRTLPAVAGSGLSGQDRPVLPPDIPQFFVPTTAPRPSRATLVYGSMVLGVASVTFSDAKLGVSLTRPVTVLAEIESRLGTVGWAEGTPIDVTPAQLGSDPEGDARYGVVPAAATKSRTYAGWEKDFKSWIAQSQQLSVWHSPQTKAVSMPGETERDFRIRLQSLTRQQRDEAVQKLRQKYAARISALDERLRRAQQSVDRESEQAAAQKLQTAVSFGATVLGALLGRKAISTSTLGRATTAARGVGRTMKESQDIARAKESVEAVQAQQASLEAQIEHEMTALGDTLNPLTEVLTPVVVKPKKTDITVRCVGLAWTPFWEDSAGSRVPAYA